PGIAILTGSPFVQLYFLYVLAGLTLLTPFFRLLSVHGSRRLQWGTGLIFLGIGMLDQWVSMIFDVGEANIATRFLPMAGFYILAGCCAISSCPRVPPFSPGRLCWSR